MTARHIHMLLHDELYVVAGTELHPAGELRGQIKAMLYQDHIQYSGRPTYFFVGIPVNKTYSHAAHTFIFEIYLSHVFSSKLVLNWLLIVFYFMLFFLQF